MGGCCSKDNLWLTRREVGPVKIATRALVILLTKLVLVLPSSSAPRSIADGDRIFPDGEVTNTFYRLVFDGQEVLLRTPIVLFVPYEIAGSIGGTYWVPLTDEVLETLGVTLEATRQEILLTKGRYEVRLRRDVDVKAMDVNGVTIDTQDIAREARGVVWIPLSTLWHGFAFRSEIDLANRQVALEDVSRDGVRVQEAFVPRVQPEPPKAGAALVIILNRAVRPWGKIEIDLPSGTSTEGVIERFEGVSGGFSISAALIVRIPLLPRGTYRATSTASEPTWWI